MNFQDCQRYLDDIQRLGMKFGLDNVNTLLGSLGDPHLDYPAVLVAGSNGKGSVCAMLTRILSLGGNRVGLYTSPHLQSVRERIRIGDRIISENDFSGFFAVLKSRIEALVATKKLMTPPTYFEILTCLAFLYFSRQKVDIAVLEVGMGGRFDATNVSNPLVSVITTISLEHQKFLGETLGQIAGEKAGVMRPGVPVICGAQEPEALAVLEDRAEHLNAPLYKVFGPQFGPARDKPGGQSAYRVRCQGREYVFRPSLCGEHQGKNAAVAVCAADVLDRNWSEVKRTDIIQGIETTAWPGRLERVSDFPPVFLDGAHNEEGARALRSFISRNHFAPAILVFACMRDKNIEKIADILFPLAEKIFATRFSFDRAADPEDILDRAVSHRRKISLEPDLCLAFRSALQEAGRKTPVVVTGSLYLVGAVKDLLRSEFRLPGRKTLLS